MLALNGPDIGFQTQHAGERWSNNEAPNSATTLHEDGVVEGGTRLSYVDQEKLRIQEELQKDVLPSNVDEEILPENSYDIQPSDGNQGLLIKEQHSIYIYEKQPRKINKLPDDVSSPVFTRDTEKQPRKKDGVQLPEATRDQEPEVTIHIQSPDDNLEISEMEGKTPEVDVQPSNVVPVSPPCVMTEQQPRKKKIDKLLDDDQEELVSTILSQDDIEETLSNNEAANSATTLHVGQETLGKENEVDKGDSRLYSIDQEKLLNDVQHSKVDEEMLPKNSHDIQPSDGDREGRLIREQNSIYERQPRKINKVPDTQDMDKQPRKKDDVQPLDVNQQRPPPMEAQDGVQLPEVLHDEGPEAPIQSPGGKRGISEMEGKTPEVGVDVQLSNIVPEKPPGVMTEKQPRKKIHKPLDDDQEELESTILSQDGNQETWGTMRRTPEVAESFQSSDLHRERSLIDEQHQSGFPPDVTQEREPRRKRISQDGNQELLEAARKTPEVAGGFQPSDLHRERSLVDEMHQNGYPPDVTRDREPRKKINRPLDDVQPADFVQDRLPRKKQQGLE